MQIEIELTTGAQRRRSASQTVIDAIQTHIQTREGGIGAGIEAYPTVIVVRANNLLHARRTNQEISSNAGRAVQQRSASAGRTG
jgi:D-serine deaminase-like pyridoxal phosphate-dependent protein